MIAGGGVTTTGAGGTTTGAGVATYPGFGLMIFPITLPMTAPATPAAMSRPRGPWWWGLANAAVAVAKANMLVTSNFLFMVSSLVKDDRLSDYSFIIAQFNILVKLQGFAC